MALKLMYITNKPAVASIVEAAGVDRIFVDMEYIGKSDRQGGMDTVQSRHTVEDVARLRSTVSRAELMVRVNPIHEATAAYSSSREEIDAAIAAGADILMLPYFKTAAEVAEFIRLVDGRARTLPLVETPEAVAVIDEILALEGIDEIYVGLNDLSLGYGMRFMFQLLADGTVDRLTEKFKARGLTYGFGGVAAVGTGMLLPAERILAEHYRLGSSCVILSRSFCNTTAEELDLDAVKATFDGGIRAIRDWEAVCAAMTEAEREENRAEVGRIVRRIAGIAE